MRWAFVSPLPPQPGGVAAYSQRLLTALRRRPDVEVDAYVDGPPHLRDAILAADEARPLAALERIEAQRGRYDAVVYNLGNSEFHTGALALLRRRPGIVVAHDVRLTNLFRFAPWQHPAGAPGGFAETLHRAYAGKLPPGLGADGAVTDDEADRWGILLAGEVIAASTSFVTTSAFAAELARLDARPEHHHRVTTMPFAVHDGSIEPAVARPNAAPALASFGVLNPLKHGPRLVRAVAALGRADVRLAFVGPASAADAACIDAAARQVGLGGRVEVTGHVDAAEYRRRLAGTTVAVQLRGTTNGESSAAVGDCLAAGLPTVVTDIGASRALPRDAVVPVDADVDAHGLATVLRGLLADDARRATIGAAARAYAEAHTFDDAADALYRVVSSSRG
jgi:glycosyltransferase involved in cell wall biosynthesis